MRKDKRTEVRFYVWPEFLTAWAQMVRRYHVSNVAIVRNILWGTSTVGLGTTTREISAPIQIGQRMTLMFSGDHAARIQSETDASGLPMAGYVASRICAAMGIPVAAGHVLIRKYSPHRVQSRDPHGPPRIRSRRGDASPTQMAGGPYWPCPEMRAKKEKVAA